MTKIRGFELVSTYTNQDLLPKRETAHAAGYDLKVAERTVIAPGEIVLVPTGVKAYMQPTEVLYLYDRSSNPRKKVLVLIKLLYTQGIIKMGNLFIIAMLLIMHYGNLTKVFLINLTMVRILLILILLIINLLLITLMSINFMFLIF